MEEEHTDRKVDGLKEPISANLQRMSVRRYKWAISKKPASPNPKGEIEHVRYLFKRAMLSWRNICSSTSGALLLWMPLSLEALHMDVSEAPRCMSSVR